MEILKSKINRVMCFIVNYSLQYSSPITKELYVSLVTSTWPPPPGFSALLVPAVDVNVKKYTPFISYLSTIVPQLYGSQDAKKNKIIKRIFFNLKSYIIANLIIF